MASWNNEAEMREMVEEVWDKTQATKNQIAGVLACKCGQYSIFSWAVESEEAWKQKYFCPKCQEEFFQKVERKDQQSQWGFAKYEERNEGTVEQWKVAEKLMGNARLMKKENILDEFLVQHVQLHNTKAKSGTLGQIECSDFLKSDYAKEILNRFQGRTK